MIEALDRQLLTTIQQGLPIVSRPYAQISQKLALTEQEIIHRLTRLKQTGLIKRFGIIVKHRNLGYRANAMVVWDIPDALVDPLGQKISQQAFVNLCYQRPRQGTLWPYNLYCMIHGKTRAKVNAQLNDLINECQLQAFQYEVLFSQRCFKQCGAVYPTTQVD